MVWNSTELPSVVRGRSCCCLVDKSYPTRCNPVDYSLQAPLSIVFSRQEYWSGLPFPSPHRSPDCFKLSWIISGLLSEESDKGSEDYHFQWVPLTLPGTWVPSGTAMDLRMPSCVACSMYRRPHWSGIYGVTKVPEQLCLALHSNLSNRYAFSLWKGKNWKVWKQKENNITAICIPAICN